MDDFRAFSRGLRFVFLAYAFALTWIIHFTREAFKAAAANVPDAVRLCTLHTTRSIHVDALETSLLGLSF